MTRMLLSNVVDVVIDSILVSEAKDGLQCQQILVARDSYRMLLLNIVIDRLFVGIGHRR